MILMGISDGKLHCRDLADPTHWSIAIKDIVLIAEYTTKRRPDSYDYFLVFVTREEGELFYLEVTGSAGGIPEAFEKLESFFGCSLEIKLQSSTDWESRVIWPQEMAGRAFYEFEEVAPKGVREHIRNRLKGRQMTKRVAEPVMRFLNESAPSAATLQKRIRE